VESRVPKLSQLIRGNELIVAPVALNPIMARMAQEAGFKAIYMSGGSLGWYKCVTEANITLPEMAQVALDMRAVCELPIILDAGGGWGDPMHVHRTIRLTEAAGFQAIEIEDQLLPRRVEHHVGIEHLVPTEFMVEKVKEALAARTDPDLIIVARTNARRLHGLDEALRRGEAFKRAGADMLFVFTRSPEEMRTVGERLPPPLMTFAPPDGFAEFAMSERDLDLDSGSPPPRAPPSPPWSRRCGSPTNVWRRARSTRSSARAMSRRR
jgi:2-methylisocitrate lyase-like PEP mutase family enzyme